MTKVNICLISLGCEKNLVDSELILGMLKEQKDAQGYLFNIVNDAKDSDVVIINTCGFIESAKREALSVIFDVLALKKEKASLKVVVCGCLVERYLEDLKKDIPEVDLFIPIKDYFRFNERLFTLLGAKDISSGSLDYSKRLISTGKSLAYLRISDGCNNRCAYCAIPLIRGNFKSRSHDDILDEFKWLVKKGYKEICLISQDLSNYGYDINDSLANLLRDLDSVSEDYFIRLLYLYPDEITDEFIEVVNNSSHIIHYFDIPLQHASNKILKLMNRRGTKEEAEALIQKIREKMPDSVIRTTMIVGFPHESDKDFNELIEFIKEIKFTHLGAFTFSKEEDTKSFNMTMQVPSRVKIERYNKLMETQRIISREIMKGFVNNTYYGIIEKFDNSEDCYLARIYMQAPDDIDGYTKIYTNKELKVDETYLIKIVDSLDYDLIGEVIDD